jgi:hypothetical protein
MFGSKKVKKQAAAYALNTNKGGRRNNGLRADHQQGLRDTRQQTKANSLFIAMKRFRTNDPFPVSE